MSHFSPSSSGASRSQLAARYAQVGVESGAGADPHLLISMLYDGALESIAHARLALRDGRIEQKGQAIGRAMRIVDQGLQGGLNKNANSLATELSSLYAYVSGRLSHAHLKNDDAALQECSRLIQPLRDAWHGIRGQVMHGANA